MADNAAEPPAKRVKNENAAAEATASASESALAPAPSEGSDSRGPAAAAAAAEPAPATFTKESDKSAEGAAAAEETGESSGDTKEELPVINWANAMEQCGDDEEFLRELLGDLKDEVEENSNKVLAALEAKSKDWPDIIRRAAHAVKGAAANLMCEQIHEAALKLETQARNSVEGNDEHVGEVKKLADALSSAHARFVDFTATM